MFERLQHLVRQQLAACFPAATFMAHPSWSNPDLGHLQVKLPPSSNSGGWPRKFLELRIRHSPALKPPAIVPAIMPADVRGEIAQVGCWSFDGAEQVAMTDFWVLVLGDVAQPVYFVLLPALELGHLLRKSAIPGQLSLYFTQAGRCFASPAGRADPRSLQTIHRLVLRSSARELTHCLNAWQQLEPEECSGGCSVTGNY